MSKAYYSRIGMLLFACNIFMSLNAQEVLKITTGTFFTTTGGVVITLNNMDFSNDGIFNQGMGQGSIEFTGTSDSFIYGNSSTLFDVLKLSKNGANVVMQQGMRIGSNIIFAGGNLELNNQNILLSPSGFLNGESEASHITGASGGYVQIITTIPAISGAKPGNLGVEITSLQDLGSVTIRRGHQSQNSGFGLGSSINRYYDITPSNNSGLNVKLRIHYLEAELNNRNENSLSIWKSADRRNWTNIGLTARNITDNFVERGGINSFSRFTLTEPTNPLPLKWGSFNTQCISGQTQITWKTLQEQNASAFIVRRSADGSSWTNIATLPAAGNSQSVLSYSFIDPQSSGRNYYYQVYEQDFDGHQTFSPVLGSQCSQPEGISVYPVPARNNCWISIQSQRRGSVSMRLYNSVGALLKQQVITVQPGNNVFELSLVPYAKGIYSMVFTGKDGKIEVIKVEKF